LIVSCKSTKKSTTQTLPKDTAVATTVTVSEFVEINNNELVEEKYPDIDVRTESVKPVDQMEATIYRYYVVIGSFKNISNARQQTVALVKEGLSPTILENENGLFRISAGGYNEENEARRRINEIRAKYANHKDVWLLRRK